MNISPPKIIEFATSLLTTGTKQIIVIHLKNRMSTLFQDLKRDQRTVKKAAHKFFANKNETKGHFWSRRTTIGDRKQIEVLLLFCLFSFVTRAGSPQQREPISVGSYYLNPPVNFPCGRKPEYPEKTTAVARTLIGGCLFIYSCSARLVSFEIKFKFINLKRN